MVAESVPATATASVIAERAADLFAKKGFAGTSIREIAQAAGVTKPTLYYHFGSKEGLVRHIIQSAMGQLALAIAGHADAGTSLRAVLVGLVRSQLEYARTHPATVALVCRLNHEPEGEPWACDLRSAQDASLEVLSARLHQAMQQGELAVRDPRVVAISFLGALLTHSMAVLRRHGVWEERSPESVANDIVELFLDGAGAPKSAAEVP